MIEEHNDMQTAMGSLVDDKFKHNEQELEDELADLLKNDKPTVPPSADRHHIPGIVSSMDVSVTYTDEKLIFQIFQLLLTTALKMKKLTLIEDSRC